MMHGTINIKLLKVICSREYVYAPCLTIKAVPYTQFFFLLMFWGIFPHNFPPCICSLVILIIDLNLGLQAGGKYPLKYFFIAKSSFLAARLKKDKKKQKYFLREYFGGEKAERNEVPAF